MPVRPRRGRPPRPPDLGPHRGLTRPPRPARVGDMPTSDPATLAATFKAYDVRGTVPDQIDEDLARRVGNAFVDGDRGGRRRRRPRHAPLLAGDVPRLRRGSRRRRSRRHADRAGLDRPALLRLRAAASVPARCSPPATTRPATTASRCAARTRRRSGWRPVWPRSATGSPSGETATAAVPGHDHRAGRAGRLRGVPARAGAGHRPAPAGGRRRRQRDGRADRAGGARAPSTSTSRRSSSSSTAPSRTTRPTRSSRPTWSTCRRR